MKTNRTVSAATLARTAVLALALINQLLSAMGKPLLPIDSAQLEQLISTGFTTVSALVNWWFNNSSYYKRVVFIDRSPAVCYTVWDAVDW